MIYFIPAWYHQDEWKEHEQLWYLRRMKSETDDTVKQIQLFQRNVICDYQILLLSHAPNLRHFLHRQGVMRAPYWSCFDAMQEVRRKQAAVFSFHSLNWPKRIEFMYSPFAVIAMLDGEKYAQVAFGEDGNPIEVSLYKGGQINRKNIYDDRGFISCTVLYENGRMAYEQYLTEQGVWKLCRFADGHVTVNPRANSFLLDRGGGARQIPYRKLSYGSMEEIIEEVLSAYLESAGDGDIFCTALHGRHMRLLNRLLADKKTIFTAFHERVRSGQDLRLEEMLSHADCLVADTEQTRFLLRQAAGGRDSHMKIALIPPYDTRLESGISQQLHVQKILFPVDHLPQERLEKAVAALAAYLKENPFARICLFTRDAHYDRKDVVLGQVRDVLKRHGFPPGWARPEDPNKYELLLEEEDRLPILFIAEQCLDELSVHKTMREQRVLVDLADVPDLFLQISAVSMGVPQIGRGQTQYLRHGKNGRVNTDIAVLGEDVAYYLKSLSHWNQAAAASYEVGRKYTAASLIRRWKEVIEEVGNSTGTAAGE